MLVAGTLGAELGRSVEDVKGIEEVEGEEGEEEGEGEEEEEGTEELATGESVEEPEGLGPVVVLLTLLKLRVERNTFVGEYKLTVYSTKEQTMKSVKPVRPVRTARTKTLPDLSRTRTLPDLSRSERSELLMRVEQRPVPGSVSPRRSYQPPVCLLGT
jgi:hypothetical protein